MVMKETSNILCSWRKSMKLSGKSFFGRGVLIPCGMLILLLDNLALLPGGSNVRAGRCSVDAADCSLPAQGQSPKLQLRAVWIATVTNTDWPSAPGFSINQQKQEYTHLLDAVQSMNMNTVIVQIKPTADAFYPSKYGPWSEWLTGV